MNLYISQTACISNQKVKQGNSILLDAEENIDFFAMLYDKLQMNYPKFFKMDTLCKLGMVATQVLLENFDKSKYKPEEIGVVLSNRSGSIEADINYFESSKTFPSPSLFVYTLPNIIIGEICIRYGFKGETAFFVDEKFDTEWTVFYVKHLMQRQNIKACICGWVDVENNHNNARLFLIEAEQKNGITFTPEALDRADDDR